MKTKSTITSVPNNHRYPEVILSEFSYDLELIRDVGRFQSTCRGAASIVSFSASAYLAFLGRSSTKITETDMHILTREISKILYPPNKHNDSD